MNENWTENYRNAAQGNDYVRLNAGLMKVKDLDNYLSSFPNTLLSFNKTGEFTYYKQLPGMPRYTRRRRSHFRPDNLAIPPRVDCRGRAAGVHRPVSRPHRSGGRVLAANPAV